MLGGPGSIRQPTTQNRPHPGGHDGDTMITINRGLVLLGALTSMTLCVVLMLTSVMMTRRHFEAYAPPTPFPHHDVHCGQSCLIGVAPDGRVIKVAVHRVFTGPQEQTGASNQRIRMLHQTDPETSSVMMSTITLPDEGSVQSATGRTLSYSELSEILGVPVEVFYRPLEGKLVTVYSEQIYTATYVQEVCEMLPSDIYGAPTDVIYLSERAQMDAMRGATDNIGLDVTAYVDWDGEINISIFCNVPPS